MSAADATDPAYWASRQLCGCVRFWPAVEATACSVLVEVREERTTGGEGLGEGGGARKSLTRCTFRMRFAECWESNQLHAVSRGVEFDNWAMRR